MSEASTPQNAAPEDAPRTAGAMLRRARQAQGLHIAALSAAIKVSQKKLELLEADRFTELPDATFTRALAQTVCRALKIDPAPVLALLPGPAAHPLEHVGEGINAPFRDRPARREPKDWGMLASPAVWGPFLIVLGAVVLYLLPGGWLPSLQAPPSAPAGSAPAGGASSVSSSVRAAVPEPAGPGTQPRAADATPGAASPPDANGPLAPANPQPSPKPATAEDTLAVTPPSSTAGVSTAAASPVKTGVPAVGVLGDAASTLRLHAKADSWIEVHDARSKLLLSRLVQAGETVGLDGPTPLRVKIGNAGATDVVFRGQPVDLAPRARDNVARLELK